MHTNINISKLTQESEDTLSFCYLIQSMLADELAIQVKKESPLKKIDTSLTNSARIAMGLTYRRFEKNPESFREELREYLKTLTPSGDAS